MTTAIRNPPFELIAGHHVLDLVNTLDWRFRESGAEELLGSYADLLRFAEESGLLTAKQGRQLKQAATGSAGVRVLSACKELREAAAEAFYAALDGSRLADAAIGKLERLFKEARANRKLQWNGSQLVWTWPNTETNAALPLWMLSLSALELMTSDEMLRVRACEKPECRWLFLDTSKNHTRRWCDMKVCGNRMKAQRFRAQRKTEAVSGSSKHRRAAS
jgi:predicted RNA-binding Zn ribbon-like protein